MEKELFVRAEEVARELGISKPYAYKLVREGLGICQLAQNRRTAALRCLFCRPLLCMAERHKRESQWPAPGVLSKRQESIQGRSCHAKTKPGVDQRQASQGFEFPFRTGIMGL